MSNIHPDINDDEIRVISSKKSEEPSPRPKPARPAKAIAWAAAIAAIALAAILFFAGGGEKGGELDLVTKSTASVSKGAPDILPDTIEEAPTAGYVAIADTVVNHAQLSIFTPVNLTPSLHIGADALNDSTAKFVLQAADIRSDNGGIVGAFVKEGELISKGQAKSGFCAIIGGKITVGVADSTPFLEQALETDGYFFRQYPLVVANQVVENKPKGMSLRRALAEWNGRPVVIMSNAKMTFHDFSQSLADLGVTNAIYLVGGKGYGFSIGPNGEKTEFGVSQGAPHRPNDNYLIWR